VQAHLPETPDIPEIPDIPDTKVIEKQISHIKIAPYNFKAPPPLIPNSQFLIPPIPKDTKGKEDR
jgi:hypothetical protein